MCKSLYLPQTEEQQIYLNPWAHNHTKNNNNWPTLEDARESAPYSENRKIKEMHLHEL